jgi:transposase
VAFLGDYSGYVQADAYKGYDAFFEKGNATEVACWAHTRRKFYDSLTTDPRRAHKMLAMIGKLYTVEQQAKEDGLDAVALKELRQQQSKPILNEIRHRLEDWSIEVLPKSPVGQAVGYARGQWIALNRYTEDGDLDIDKDHASQYTSLSGSQDTSLNRRLSDSFCPRLFTGRFSPTGS